MRTALDSDPERLDKHEKNIVANIREHGWFATHVHNNADDPDPKPTFSYTTGLWVTLGVPELIIFSMKRETAHKMFWSVFRALKAGQKFGHGARIPDVLNNLDVALLPIDKRAIRQYMGWSMWFYGGDDFSCDQLIWPDRENRFPWHPGFDEALREDQPDLTRGAWNGLAAN